MGSGTEPLTVRVARSLLFDRDDFAQLVAGRIWATSILEIGCGDGALLERLARAYPKARLVGIDPGRSPGRLFRGERARVDFRRASAAEYAPQRERSADLVILCDLLHRLPEGMHRGVLMDAVRILMPGGVLVLKEWDGRGRLAAAVARRLEERITGRRYTYQSAAYWARLLRTVFRRVETLGTVRPRSNNIVFMAQDPAPAFGLGPGNSPIPNAAASRRAPAESRS